MTLRIITHPYIMEVHKMSFYQRDYDMHQSKAAAYVRLSREDGDKLESDSIANQKKFIERYIENSENIFLSEYYIDDGYTGTNFDRPAFRQMISDIEDKKIDCIIVKDLSRFGRDYIDAGKYLEREFPKRHIRFISINDGIDNLNQRYDITMPIKNIINAQYAEDISKKVLSSISMKQKSGLFIGAFTSYGYAKDPTDRNKLVVDEAASVIVRKIFNMFLNGIGTQTIAKRLNADKIPCPSMYKAMNGEKYHNSNKLKQTSYWTYSTVRHILKNQMYIGDMVQHVTNASRYNYDSRIVPESEWIIVKGTHEPIITYDVWKTAQDMMKARYKSTNLKSSHIFAGIIKCKECGRGMTKISYKGVDQLACGSYKRLGSTICTRHGILMDKVYEIVLNSINEHISKLCDIETAITNTAKFDKRNRDIEKRLNILQNNIERVKHKKINLYNDYQDKLLTREEFIEYNAKYTEEIEFSENEILRLRQDLHISPIEETQKAWFQNLIKNKKSDSLSRELILSFIDVIYVSEPKKNIKKKGKKLVVEIVFNFKEKIRQLQEVSGL